MRPADNRGKLAYAVSFFATIDNGKDDVTRPTFIIDAMTGATLYHFEGLTYVDATGPGGNEKIGRYTYGAQGQFPALDVKQEGETCTMESATARTMDMMNKKKEAGGGKMLTFNCFENTYKFANGAYSPANDAHHFAHVIYRMYREWYGVEPLDPTKVKQLVMRVHYGDNFANAFWNGRTMTFGDGGMHRYPFVVLDVAGHEVSHGFTEFNSGLLYEKQSGGINEAFSDMAGETVKSFNLGGKEPDFMHAAGSVKPGSTGGRNMCDPKQDGRSINSLNDYHDGLNVHYSSGIFNKAFCLLAKSPGWTARKAFHVFLVANQNYWRPSTGFVDGARGVLDAARDLQYSEVDVRKAFEAVDIVIPRQ